MFPTDLDIEIECVDKRAAYYFGFFKGAMLGIVASFIIMGILLFSFKVI